nr:hypothetical protein [Kibdelosporangium sp. MJ126-NF4]
MEVGAPNSNIKDQVRALEELHEKLPSLDTPEPPSIKRDLSGRARQLGTEQVEQLIADYQSGATVYELSDRFGIERSATSSTDTACRCAAAASHLTRSTTPSTSTTSAGPSHESATTSASTTPPC